MSTLEYNPNSPEAMLYAYVDGELHPEMDADLFGHLSTNSALRAEMRELLAIRRGIQDDDVAAPIALPGNILAAAGLPALTGAVGTAAGMYGLKALLAAMAKPVAFTVLGALITWGGMSYYNSQNNQATLAQKSGTSSSITTEQKQIEQPAPIQQPEIPVIKNESYSTEIRNYSLQTKQTAPKVVFITDNDNQKPLDFIKPNNNNAVNTDNNNTGVLPVKEQGTFAAMPLPTAATEKHIDAPSNASPTSMLLLSNPEPSSNNDVQIRLRSLYTIGTTSTVGNQQDNQHILHNTAASLLYSLSQNTFVGVEVGREQFTQEFTGTENGITASYKATPTLMWYGAHVEQTFNPIQSLGIRPVVGVTAGFAGNFLYGMVRTQVGLQYAPADNINLLLGLEGTGLTYQFQGKPYTSLKYGLTYGVSVRF
ncbi:MAG: hypothetical protein U0Y96_00530 [Candidatus Kapaibacterium sp.]|nr:hypothetical protein [Bacteroidota bacterium]